MNIVVLVDHPERRSSAELNVSMIVEKYEKLLK